MKLENVLFALFAFVTLSGWVALIWLVSLTSLTLLGNRAGVDDI
jgi:general stress protein CsbA